MTPERLAEIEARAAACFRGPWTAETWEVECPLDDDECEIAEHDVETILAPDEYPSEQVVAQVDDRGRIHTPGLAGFASAHARFIAAARTDVPDLVARIRELEGEAARLGKMLDVCSVTHEHNVRLKGERDAAREEARTHARAVGAIDAALGISGSTPVEETVEAVGRAVRERDAARERALEEAAAACLDVDPVESRGYYGYCDREATRAAFASAIRALKAGGK